MTAIKNEASSFAMSALGVIADIADPVSCPLMTQSRHRPSVSKSALLPLPRASFKPLRCFDPCFGACNASMRFHRRDGQFVARMAARFACAAI